MSESKTEDGDEDLPFGGRLSTALDSALQTQIEKALAKGVDLDKIEALVDTIPFDSLLSDASDAVYGSLGEGLASLIEYLDEGQRLVHEALVEVWGPADRLYRACVYAAYELGAVISRASKHHNSAVFALLGLHGRAVRIAAEVRHLAMGGFESGATARWRSLHDISVVCFVLREAPEGITERYLAYSHIERWADLRNYQKHAAALGLKPYTDGEVEEAKAAADQVVAQWGPTMRELNGWAAPLFTGAKRILFSQLEELAGLDHLRPFYRLGKSPRPCGSSRFDPQYERRTGA